jgi:hypothetical protein
VQSDDRLKSAAFQVLMQAETALAAEELPDLTGGL